MNTESILQTFESYSRKIGLPASEVARIQRAVQEMLNKSIVHTEEMAHLNEVLPRAIQLFANAEALTSRSFMDMVHNGELNASETLANVATYIDQHMKDKTDPFGATY